jgi:hypothetical protein
MMLISHVKHESNKIGRNFLLEKCILCAQEMILTEGSVILGSGWYHKECFAKIETELNTKHGDELNC